MLSAVGISTLFWPFFFRDLRAERREMRENAGHWKWGLARKWRKEGALGRKGVEKRTCPPCLKRGPNSTLFPHHDYWCCCVFLSPNSPGPGVVAAKSLQMLSDSSGWLIQLLPKTACIILQLLFRVWSALLPFYGKKKDKRYFNSIK